MDMSVNRNTLRLTVALLCAAGSLSSYTPPRTGFEKNTPRQVPYQV